ncbi:aminotransferase class I/II-fold pyridoxal phosphate-dependent enzyme [Skermanella sp. TT6]|uniref:Aminotransferase class I/II-fold pyridoxal phosphate-dependent enzyme n=1 Tax=Skermanella cutis TaxID=2775420 RepID=A0ABX7B6P5_9PROT|nr:aminotransferase class I/II-fold pyridoxal phosphate-dependent enzyme [Skermanella sp. TT6]QQP89809.1 aminotransferase class I/II-fold pyridoxal phosphate-dependent enzyme [Skermanella sp. TT6]
MLSSPLVNDRLGRLSDYPFTRLAALLAGITPRANAEPVVMSVGEPQHAPPALIDEVLRTQAHLWGKYPPVAGTPEFRAAAARWLDRRYGLPAGMVEPDRMVLPVAGTREALFLAALLAVPESKAGMRPAVLLPNPFYAAYEGAAVMAGAEAVFLTTTRETGFLPDLDALSPELLDRTALFYLCTPSNPQGAVADRSYLTRAIGLARRHGFVLAVDECYAEIYDAEAPTGVLEVAAALQARGEASGGGLANLLVFHSLSKRSNAAGLRSGFVAGDPDLIALFSRLRSYSIAGTPLPALAAAAALWDDDVHVVENRALYRAKFDAAESALDGRFGFYRPAGGFFLWLDVGDGEAAAATLWREGGIKVLPGAYLTRPDADGVNRGSSFIRIALVHDAATVAEACTRIAKIL